MKVTFDSKTDFQFATGVATRNETLLTKNSIGSNTYNRSTSLATNLNLNPVEIKYPDIYWNVGMNPDILSSNFTRFTVNHKTKPDQFSSRFHSVTVDKI